MRQFFLFLIMLFTSDLCMSIGLPGMGGGGFYQYQNSSIRLQDLYINKPANFISMERNYASTLSLEINTLRRGITHQNYWASTPDCNVSNFNMSLNHDDVMKKIRKRSYISGALFLPAMVTGFMLSNSSKPPNTFLLTAHKFSTVSDLILLDISTFQKKKAIGLSLGEKIAAITMNVCFVSTIGTGGALSINKPMPDIIHTTHSITPWLTALSSGVLLYLLNNIQ